MIFCMINNFRTGDFLDSNLWHQFYLISICDNIQPCFCFGVKKGYNIVSKIDSNGNDMSEKKDLEPKVGKILEDNEVKDLEDGMKAMIVDKKKTDGEEELEMEDDKKADDGDVITDDDTKIGEGIKEDKKVDEGKETKEDEKDVGI